MWVRSDRQGRSVQTYEGRAVGDRAKHLAELYETHSLRALRFAYVLTGVREVAEDLVQEAFLRTFGRLETLREEEAFPGYLRQTVLNLARAYFRRRRIERLAVGRHALLARTPQGDQPDIEERESLWRAIHRLPTGSGRPWSSATTRICPRMNRPRLSERQWPRSKPSSHGGRDGFEWSSNHEEVEPMKDVDVELRRVMRERAAIITSAPPLPGTLAGPRRGLRLSKGRRPAMIVAVAAAIGLGAGVAVSQVLDSPEPPTVTPVTERFVVASGETPEGPWKLTAYRAELAGQWWTGSGFEHDVRTAWCLDLDAPGVEGPGDPPTQRANACTFEGEEGTIEPINISARHPEFNESEALVYGEVSSEVVSLDVGRAGGQRLQATIVRAPAEWDLPVDYYFAFISGRGKVDLVARDSNGEVLEEQHI